MTTNFQTLDMSDYLHPKASNNKIKQFKNFMYENMFTSHLWDHKRSGFFIFFTLNQSQISFKRCFNINTFIQLNQIKSKENIHPTPLLVSHYKVSVPIQLHHFMSHITWLMHSFILFIHTMLKNLLVTFPIGSVFVTLLINKILKKCPYSKNI